MRPGWPQALMVLPTQGLLVLVIGLPSLWVFWLSLQQTAFGEAPVYVGWSNYAFVLTDPYFWRAFLNTFLVVNIVVYLELALALGMAVLFAAGVPLRRLMIAVVLAPYAVSEVIAVIVWKYMLEPDVGIVSQALAAVGIPELAWTTDRWAALTLVALLSVWLHLPFSFLILYSARLGVPSELYESASIDGALPWQQFLKVTVPMLMPAILVALMFRYVFAFRIFGEVWLLTGGGPARLTEVLATYLYRHAFRYQEFGVASAIGWLMALASVLLASAYLYQMYRRMLASDA
ncbi:MAG TPA: sugar ABC transporter permease [Geminicoccaceae bacterium]|nr:sugar ABC transporter permease [Geminicoccus sp.]HMU48127.1 sugar ABC transporter permease [Geminicoccaceae bacterium]